MFIPDETVEAVRSASDVVDVIGDYVRLRRKGANYFGLCPFHDEKTPSFSVNAELGIFKCFGCGAGGDLFRFVMQVEGISFPEAVRMLAEKGGIALPAAEAEQSRLGETESVYNALRFAARFYHSCLTKSEKGRPARDYLQAREFSKATVKAFGLGFAPDEWDGLLRAAREHRIEEGVLEKAGLILSRKDGSGYYDRFRGRIVFPIFSHVGKVLGFGARVLNGGPDEPKYVNSPETVVYNKSRVLYGLYQAKHAIRKKEEVLVVEGYTDVMALHQEGVDHAVASSGTALTQGQVKLLGRYARRIILLFDADMAGTVAATRAIDVILQEGASVYVVALPRGEDPDSFARKEGVSLEAYVEEHRADFVTYIQERARGQGRLATPEGEAETMHAILHAVSLISDPLMQETYVRRASEVLRVPEARLHEVLERLRRGVRGKDRRPVGPAANTPSIPRAETVALPVRDARQPLPEEKTLIRLMFEYGSSMVEFVLGNTSLDVFTSGTPRKTVECFLSQYESGQMERRAFLDGSFGDDVQRLVADVVLVQHEPSENWERKQKITVPRRDEDPYKTAVSAMTLLKMDRVNDAIERQLREIRNAEQSGGELQAMQVRMMELHELRRRISREREDA